MDGSHQGRLKHERELAIIIIIIIIIVSADAP
jgi:hypothetical protein